MAAAAEFERRGKGEKHHRDRSQKCDTTKSSSSKVTAGQFVKTNKVAKMAAAAELERSRKAEKHHRHHSKN